MGLLVSLSPTAMLVMDDPDFGPLRASPARCDATWLWESLELVETPRGRVDLAFAAGPKGPSDAHRRQLKWVTARLDSLKHAAAPMIVAKLGCANPVAEIEWEGAHLTGRDGEFSLYFSCANRPETLFVVHFRGATPIAAEVED